MYICIARIRKTPLTHCQRNANNRRVFRVRRNCSGPTVGLRRLLGSEFQTVGPAEAKERQPKVLQRFVLLVGFTGVIYGMYHADNALASQSFGRGLENLAWVGLTNIRCCSLNNRSIYIFRPRFPTHIYNYYNYKKVAH